MPRASTPWWQQATALVSLTAGGAVTGFSFVPKATVDFSSPASLPVNLLALQHSVGQTAPGGDATLRTAIVNVARHYLQLAQEKTPAEMEAMIWQQDSLDHADHGPSCAAFASLTLELAAKVVGQHSWVTGGSSYPWPLHSWADVRVDENPASPGIISVQQDAQQHGRWHPLGDGYQPQPGDWVLFNGHVEVVTEYAHGVLHTIGGDSLPNFSVNAHQYADPLAGQGVAGFVNNGSLSTDRLAATSTRGAPHAGHGRARGAHPQASQAVDAGQAAIPGASPASPAGQHGHRQHAADPGHRAHGAAASQADAAAGLAAIPGSAPAAPAGHRARERHPANPAASGVALADAPGGQADIPGATGPGPGHHQKHPGSGSRHAGVTEIATGGAAIPGLAAPSQHDSGRAAAPSGTSQPRSPSSAPAGPAASAQQAFIDAVAPGAITSQRNYGVPAAVTIAQAIEESDWGHSVLASKDNNLFGMKGTGPAGSDQLPTQEYQNGQWVSTTAPFRVYHNFAESIDDHGRLLANSGYYQQAMAVRRAPNAFASALTGVYATDPSYGAKLISLMQQYNLYQYDAGTPSAPPGTAPAQRPSPQPSHTGQPTPARPTSPAATPTPAHSPAPTPSRTPAGSESPTPAASHTGPATPGPSASQTGPATAASPATHSSHTATPAATPTGGPTARPATPLPGQATIPGVADPTRPPRTQATPQPPARAVTRADRRVGAHRPGAHPAAQPAVLTAEHLPGRAGQAGRPASPRRTWTTLRRYRPEIPPSVHTAFLASAKVPLRREEPLYREVAAHADIPWKVLAAADWMQCEARSGYSPVHGEKLGVINPDGTCYTTRSAGLAQAADDLRDLAWSVYQIDLTERRPLSVGDLASVFAAFRWGQLLVVHRTSALEFPYSVAGLTTAHLHMRWPKIDQPDAPDKPGTRFRRPFGAVPIVLGLGYPAVV